jgi:CheY-like chemotaxis protein
VSDYEPIAVSRPVGEKPVLKTILVVDDELQTADMISRYLIQEGYHTIIATSGEEAMTLASRQIPFAIILDIVMPDMDGWEVLQGLKKNPDTRNIPVIIVSIAEDRETGFALGAIGYVTKPVFKKRLISEIQKVNWPDTRSIMIVDDNDIDRREMGREHSPKSKRAETSTGLPRILLVEDNEAAIIQVRSILESSGYVVDVSRGGQEAIDYVSHTVPDGIVLDLMMPEIDGFEVLEKIRGRSDTAKIPVLILTAKNLTPEDFKKLSANNVQQLVQKGDVGRESLLLKISSMLEKETKADAGKPKPDTKKMSPIAGTSQKTTLLIVEDNPDNMITIKAVLQHRFGIIEACDGEEGLQMAAEKRPDLILLDMALPKVDGITVVQHLKNDRELNHIPVIAMTAKVMKGDREEILGAGCDDYIAKPIDPVDFFEKITQWLKR